MAQLNINNLKFFTPTSWKGNPRTSSIQKWVELRARKDMMEGNWYINSGQWLRLLNHCTIIITSGLRVIGDGT
jgi:hypothetical protein